MRLKCDDCGATVIAHSIFQASEQGFQPWGPYEDGEDGRRIWRCGPCNDAYFRRNRIIEEIVDKL